MSRNLCQRDCYYCGGDVALVGPVAPITKAQARHYFDEFEGMLVADAECSRCEAKYLAWVDESTRVDRTHSAYFRIGDPFCDLSFRSTFNDEPGEADKPKYRIIERFDREPWTGDEFGCD